ncbi:hypothetical protein BDR07DRAFT_1377082 [Suillus spraguei]|nr:hypothetical protein BDR07DRAFT_1377082 [Suillus spraguei]
MLKYLHNFIKAGLTKVWVMVVITHTNVNKSRQVKASPDECRQVQADENKSRQVQIDEVSLALFSKIIKLHRHRQLILAALTTSEVLWNAITATMAPDLFQAGVMAFSETI